MQVRLSEEQILLLDTVTRFVEAELPLSETRKLHDHPAGFDHTWLQKAAELGWFAMLVPEADGGGSISGKGLLDAAIVAEVLGRHCQPGPFLPMNVVASAVARHGSVAQRQELLPGMVSGEAVATWAWANHAGDWDAGAGMTVRRTGDTIHLSGRRGYVQDAPSAEHLLVAARLDGSPVQFLVPTLTEGITVTPLHTLDLSRRLAHVDFNDVLVPADQMLGAGGEDQLDDQLHVALVLLLAETVGAADALFTMTVGYAQDRVAFGRPIGSFQAIKHILADQALALEVCKAGAVAAAEAVQEGGDRAGEVVSMVASGLFDRATELAQQCLQVHGGIGYTWEHDLHLLLRRIQSNAGLYGEPAWHRERICRLYRLGEAGD
jgi:alkylation response protein AidB-like acyl-CoA dehydrogenase